MNKVCNGRDKQCGTGKANSWDYYSSFLILTIFLVLLFPLASQAKPAVPKKLRIIYGGSLLGTIKPCG